ncbi:hypothetical protein HMH05_27115 [Pseudomonas sp. SbB1]|uniref:Uncharacterized protein n=1 Tax=Pseudomonas putida (strain GB-1) TaxID=76869 RepID=B0KJ01_PSEPG|nr:MULTISPECIES: hypothetical protein [Pseudomonas]ABZ00691.1 hypothetical protein PputGB1_4804 [Pseudomonas putida GB-1]ANI32589.1 hypothetical protein AA098_03350 [Pseudomonas sp. JY-Q]MBP0711626.1 hypothetical protein [Pseudomonas sp. T34]MCK2191083.1 hypothetical protein [Pseudomonas sp. MB04B]MDD2088486.1 hypothetical protein [Pseudomonas putida]
MSDEFVIEYHIKELSDFQLKRIARAMVFRYSPPVTAYLSDVFIASECAVGIVFGHTDPGQYGQRADGHIFQTSSIEHLKKVGRYWVITTAEGRFVLTSFKRGLGRAGLRALTAGMIPTA